MTQETERGFAMNPINPVTPETELDEAVTVEWDRRLQHRVQAGRFSWVVDEPVDLGGDDSGPTPYDLFLAALGSCTAMTIRMYAKQKQWPLETLRIRLTHERDYRKDCVDCTEADKRIERIHRVIEMTGDLTPEQIDRLRAVASRCPVHKTISGNLQIEDHVQWMTTGV